jgi:hypothetical protein
MLEKFQRSRRGHKKDTNTSISTTRRKAAKKQRGNSKVRKIRRILKKFLTSLHVVRSNQVIIHMSSYPLPPSRFALWLTFSRANISHYLEKEILSFLCPFQPPQTTVTVLPKRGRWKPRHNCSLLSVAYQIGQQKSTHQKYGYSPVYIE